MEEFLRAQWRGALAEVSPAGVSIGSAADATLTRLLARYREPHRRYHGVTHLARALATAEELFAAVPVHHPGAVRLALFFHDAVYDPRASGNEAASAVLARGELCALGVETPVTDTVASFVEATADHAWPSAGDDERGGGSAAEAAIALDAAVVLDADLAVLAAEPAAYSAYVNGIRAEYAHVPEDEWRVGRAAVLRRFLDRPALFLTAPLRAREARARANISAELAALADDATR